MTAGRRPGVAIMAVGSVMPDFTIRVFAASGGHGPSASWSKLRPAYPSRRRAWPRGRAASDHPSLWRPAVAGPTAIWIPHRQISCDV